MKNIVLTSLCLLSMGCASVHPGKFGKSVTSTNVIPLKVSAKEVDVTKGSPLRFLEVTLENTSADWVRLSGSSLTDTENAQAVLGKDLEAWAESKRYQNQVNEHNEDAIAGVLVLAGAAAVIAGGHGNNSGLVTTGAVAAGAGYGKFIAKEVSKDIDAAEQSKRVPESHLFSDTIIPAKMFTRRWILINKPLTSSDKQILVAFKTVDGKSETYAINY